MHIALFHNVPSGGAKRAIYEWTRWLTGNHEIDVYSLSSADHVFCDIRPLVKRHRVFDFTPRRLFGSPWGRVNQLQRWRDLGELTRIGQRIADEINVGNYDVVFAHTCRYTFIPALLQFIQVPSIYYLHEPFGRRLDRRFQRPYLKNNKWRERLDRFDPLIRLYNHRLEATQRRSMRQTKRILANSQFTKEQMEMAFGVNVSVCYCGVDFSIFHPMPGIDKENHVISVGELSPRKGFDFIVESLARISPEFRPKLVLACNSVNASERAYVQGLANQFGVNLQVLTNLSSDELAIEYNKARLCVYAPVLEPFGLVPLEAMSCSTAVVSVQEAGVQESVIHEYSGLLVRRDPKRFAEAVQHLLLNPSLASEYGRNGRECIMRNWTWDQSGASLEEHLNECSRNTRQSARSVRVEGKDKKT